jgi:hypothetical protein
LSSGANLLGGDDATEAETPNELGREQAFLFRQIAEVDELSRRRAGNYALFGRRQLRLSAAGHV